MILAHALQELTHPHIALQRMVDIADEAIVRSPTLAIGRAGCIWVSKVVCPCLGHAAPLVRHPQHSLLHRYGLRRTVLSTSHRHYRGATIAGPAQHFLGRCCPIFSPPAPFTVSVALAANRAGADGVGDSSRPSGSNPLVLINSSCTTVLFIQRSSHHRLPRNTASPEAPIKPS